MASHPVPALAPPASRHAVLNTYVDATSYAHATSTIMAWAHRRASRYVCVANVHVTMEAYDDPSYADIVNGADLVTPDGVPLVWTMRLLGDRGATRVYGPDLMLHVCRAAADAGVPVALYGGTAESLGAVTDRLCALFPALSVACTIAPPFRRPTPAEEARYLSELRASKARIVFVGIGCPKQERWMATHRGRLAAVMLGVGAAFDFHAGRVRQAPAWMQRVGMEWVFRLAMEPRRLWRRYAKHNPRFAVLVARQLLAAHGQRPRSK